MIRIAPQAGFLLRWLLNSRVGSRPLHVWGVSRSRLCYNLPGKAGLVAGKDKE